MSFTNALLMTVRSFLWTEATTESTKHQKVEATSFDETCEVKKATNFEKLHDMKKEKKKEHLRLAISSHFRRKDISCVEKHYLPQNTKHLPWLFSYFTPPPQFESTFSKVCPGVWKNT